MTNWYKKSQLNIADEPKAREFSFNWAEPIERKEQGWDRFLLRAGTPWEFVVEMDVGKPTEEEKYKIIKKGLYNKVISPETIEILKKTSVIK